MAFKKNPGPSPGADYRLVFSKTIRLKNGRILRAESYGLKAFAFWTRSR
jgi:hypothetical protein